MSSPWNTIAVLEANKIEDIVSEELKEKLRRKTIQCAVSCPEVKWKSEMTDEELAKVLQEEYDIIYSEEDAYSSEDCEYNSDSDLEDLEDLYYEKFNQILEKFDPIPLYNCKQRQDDINSKTRKQIIVAVDPTTKLILNGMIEKKIFDKVHCTIKKTKSSIVFVRKYLRSPDTFIQREYVVKVFERFLPSSRELKYSLEKRYYPRLYKILEKPICEKVEKEAIYLGRLKKAGIPCPEVITLERHVLVLSHIGGKKPALSLKDSRLDCARNLIAYKQIVEYMKMMYGECNLIHTNLTEENILWHKDCCYVISLSSALEPHEENALNLLFYDCTNVCKFFKRVGVPFVVSPNTLYRNITGQDYFNIYR